MTSNKRKNEQLKMNAGTAAHRLKKELLFKYVKKAGDNFCYQCGVKIEFVDELSVEHKTPWLNSNDPIELFFNLENIAFSHLECNIGAARRYNKLDGFEDSRGKHGIIARYRRGCRCEPCREIKKLDNAKRKNHTKPTVG